MSQINRLQKRLIEMYGRVFPDPLEPRTVVVVPSLSMDTEELAKIEGVHHYEERLLCLLMLLQMPNTQLIYITSQPVSPTVIDYFLHLLPGIPSIHARRRLKLLNCHDSSSRPLAEKVLDRPRLIRKIKEAIRHPESAHLSCFNSTDLERELSLKLKIPLYATDPGLGHLGSKSGSRDLFVEAGVPLSPGFSNLQSFDEIIDSLAELKKQQPDLQRAVIKLNEGFSGEGNATIRLEDYPSEGGREWLREQLPQRIKFEAAAETWDRFLPKFVEMQGIVEAFVEGEHKESPSVQCRINPIGEVEVISTHDQILGGPTGQVFLGCRFPANKEYRLELQEAGRRVGEQLRDHGAIGRFGVDFVSVKTERGWEHYAIEINLRKGGTTHPFMMLQFLTNGNYEYETGEFIVPGGESRCYIASDNVCSPDFKGLAPDDLIDIAVENNLHFHSTIQQGVVFHLIGALSEFGKFGLVSIGDTPENAQKYYDETLEALNRSCHSSGSPSST